MLSVPTGAESSRIEILRGLTSLKTLPSPYLTPTLKKEIRPFLNSRNYSNSNDFVRVYSCVILNES